MGTELGSISIIQGTGGILHQDIWKTIENRMRDRAPEIGRTIEELVREKTFVLTGALQESITFKTWPDVDDVNKDLAWIYASDVEQIQEWTRIYVQYQEGGMLGDHTYTNDPRLMFFTTATTDGPPFVMFWALKTLGEAIDELLAGNGIPYP